MRPTTLAANLITNGGPTSSATSLIKIKKLTLDFETLSTCELKHAGAFKYSLDPTTKPTCLAIKAKDEDRIWFFDFVEINRPWKELPRDFRNWWLRKIEEGYLFTAHNAFFERCIYTHILVKRYGWPSVHRKRWRCTAAKAAACALPRNLEGAGESINLDVQKDKRGHAAMMATCKPTKHFKAWKTACEDVAAGKRVGKRKQTLATQPAPPMFLTPEAAPDVWKTLYRYCRIDVLVEEELDDHLPDLIPDEQEIWFLNQQINWRGLKIDVPTIEKVVTIMAAYDTVKRKELDTLTLGMIKKPGAINSILEFLAMDNVILPNLRAKTIDDFLATEDITDDARKLLEIRKALSKTSVKKYQAFLKRAGRDGRVRDFSLYCGASTGREAGTGSNPYNLPKTLIDQSSVEEVIELLQYDTHGLSEWVQLVYGNLGVVFSSLLRSMFTPSDGCELFVADFAKIEVAVLWWLAGNEAGLDILRSGKDPYIYQAAANMGKTYEEIKRAVDAKEKWAYDARQLGKAQILGCGYGMAWKKFQSTAWDQYRLKLTGKESVKAVTSYRDANETVPKLWRTYEQAAIQVIEDGGVVKAAKCKFFKDKKFLWVELPSGRRLAYRSPRIVWQVREFDILVVDEITGRETIERRTSKPSKTIEFMGLDKSKKRLAPERTWGGTLTENIDQAISRDIMMGALLRLENAGYPALWSVYDEAICERPVGEGDLKEFLELMLEPPKWADEELFLDANGWVGDRYRK